MASFLYDLVKPCVEKLIDGAIAEARHVFCFTCIVKEFEEERTRLEPERKTIEQRVKVAKERDKDIQANVVSWQKDIDELNQVDTKTKQTCCFEFCPDCIWRYKKGKELTDKVKRIKELKEKGEKFENIELLRPVPGIEHYSSKDFISFESREEKYKELLDALKDDNNYITGLQGMGGTGKTTLAIKVGKDLKQSKHFAYVVDTTVSFTPHVKKIQDEIAGPLGLNLEDFNESDRPKKLWSRLTNGNKILVILDDVWDPGPPLDFDAIGIPKQDNCEGCRVLVTSRTKETFINMGCHKIIELDVLSEEDAWTMFKWYAGIHISSGKLIDKGREIAKECKQLPVAISVIASSLKGHQHREHKWDVTLKSLKKPVFMRGVDNSKVGIYNCLKISYDNLMDENIKRLFLLCSVFREDEEYSVEVLTRLCIGVGLCGEDYGSYNDARNQVVEAKDKLVDSCLLLEVGEKHLRIRMHDLVREAAQWIAKEEIQCVNLLDKKQKSLVEKHTNIKYLLCEGKCTDFLNLKFDGSKLETLIVKVDRDEDCERIEVPNSFFENVIKLRALYFSGKNCRLLSLPPSIQLLSNIRSMSFDDVDLGDISILGKLQSLETLDLVDCKINELPNQITELKKFKLLKLKCCKIRKNNPFEVIKRCSSLEELYFNYSFNVFCKEITLPELQRYHIDTDINWFSISLERTKYVVFGGDEERQLSEGTLKYCMQTAEGLSLRTITGEWRNLMPEIVELGMNDLVELYLRGMPQLRCLVDTIGSQVPNVLSKLVVLHLERLENLEELFNGPISLEFLNNLEKLSIEYCWLLTSLSKCKLNLCNLKTIIVSKCDMLVSLFEVSTSRSLVLLEKLEINDCRGLKTIIADERREDEEIDDNANNKSHGSVFSKLKVIDIKRCHRLESILPSLSAQDLPVLETISIRDCDGLKYVFGQSQHVELVSLSQVELSELPNFIGIFEECYDPMSSCVKGSSSTSNYGSKSQIQLDPIKCNIFSWTHICCHTIIPLVDGDQPHDYTVASEPNSYRLNIWERVQCLPIKSKILCNIKEVKLNCLPKMKSVIILSFVPIMLLETLEIRNCGELKHIIIDIGDHNTGGNNWVNVFPKLKKLHVAHCPLLKYIFGHETNDPQNHMEVQLHFPELRQLELYNLPSLVAMCPEQYRTTFPSLKILDLSNCFQVDIKSIGDFNIHSVSESLDNRIIKELSGNVDHFLTLEILEVYNNSKVENIFSLNEIDGQQLDLGLQDIKLSDLPMMTCLFVGPKNSFALKNLTRIKIKQCEKLKIAFSTSMLRFLPQLLYLRIEECKELEHIIDDDLENKKNSNSLSSRTCFPNLQVLSVIKCNKLKFVFPFSVCKELPKLGLLMIIEANELEEIFKSDDDQKVDIPNLNTLAFDMLPSLCYAQGNQFQAVKNRLVQNCEKLTLTSTLTLTNPFTEINDLRTTDRELYWTVMDLLSAKTTEDVYAGIEIQATSDTESDLASVENVPNISILATDLEIQLKQTQEAEHKFVQNVPDLAILPTSIELLNEQSMDQQHSLGEIDTIVKLSQINNLEGSTSEETAVATVSTISGTNNEPPIQVVASKLKGIEIGGTSKTNNDQVSVNGDAFMKVNLNSNVEKQFSKDDEIIVSKSKPSPNITSSITSQFPSMPSKGDPSQKVEDLSSSLLVKWELEQLISMKHLKIENLSLLTDFLVENASVRLKDTSLSNKYKGCAYNSLAELLKFLKTHSLLEVSGSSHSEFVELLQDARSFAFDKEWLDGAEWRTLFPEIQVSPDDLEKLLNSKKQITKNVKDLKLQLTSSEADLESIIQQEAVLRAPIGY